MTEIYVALAAKALTDLGRLRDKGSSKPQEEEESLKKIIDNLKKADEHSRMYEYTWLIRGFYEMRQGDLKRAEDNFKYVHDRATKGTTNQKKKFQFGALIGLGVVAYARQKFGPALEHFSKAIQAHPGCSATVRVAVASCCFKLEQYEKARSAIDKAISLDPSLSESLVLLALLEQVAAQKDKQKRQFHRVNAYEYCALASAIDPSNAMAWNHMANHCFHTWINVESAFCISNNTIQISLEESKEISAGDLLTIEKVPGYNVQSVQKIDDVTVIVLGKDQYIDESFINKKLSVDVKELGKVTEYAKKALSCTSIAAIKSESYYMMGRVYHIQMNYQYAWECYKQALKDLPENTLAAFGVAQILFSRNDLTGSLEIFEKVLSKHPDDKDTNAYVLLIKAITKKEVGSMDKVREVAPGFQHEIDLWLVQGELRHKDPTEFSNALKCYLNAIECMEQKGSHIDSNILSNVSVLYHSLGKLSRSIDYIKRALLTIEEIVDQNSFNPIFKNASFEGIFYSWSEGLFSIQAGETPGVFTGDSNEISILSPDDEILVNDILYTVISVSDSNLTLRSPLMYTTQPTEESLQVKRKVPFHNFCDQSMTICYNFARVLEDIGQVKAAIEIYVELLKRHPVFKECYLRLSKIYNDMGNLQNASIWLSRALDIDELDPDANISLGDLHNRTGNAEQAKKCYEKVIKDNRHDPRGMLSLGNFYFDYLDKKSSKYPLHLKESYKYFWNTLNEDHLNIYAASGLGMVCAEKERHEVAREIFSRARETNMPTNEDICANLAHIHQLQGRLVDAEHLYEATIKSLSNNSKQSEKTIALRECTAMAQYLNNRYDVSLHSLLKSIHQDPGNLRLWYNVAVVHRANALAIMKRGIALSRADIEDASKEMSIASKLFSFLASTDIPQNSGISKGVTYDKVFASTCANQCQEQLVKFSEQLHKAAKNDDARDQQKRRQEDEARKREAAKREEEERKARVKEALDAELREKAAKTKERLAAVLSNPIITSKDDENKDGKKASGKKKKNTLDIYAFDNDDEEEDNSKKIDFDAINDVASSSMKMFGSDDEDDDANPAPVSSNNNDKEEIGNSDIFGEDSDNDEPSSNTNKLAKRKREIDDDDDDINFDDEKPKSSELNINKRRNIITDDDDDQ